MFPSDFFRHCPRCAVACPGPPGGELFECSGCGFRLYFNPAVSVSAFLEREDGQVLMIRRAKDPSLGKLAPPGGFVDFGETAEDSLRREVREETALEFCDLRYLVSHPNRYTYREVTYRIVDLFFVARVLKPESARALDGVSEVLWSPPSALKADDMAFPSTAAALRAYQLQCSHAP